MCQIHEIRTIVIEVKMKNFRPLKIEDPDAMPPRRITIENYYATTPIWQIHEISTPSRHPYLKPKTNPEPPELEDTRRTITIN